MHFIHLPQAQPWWDHLCKKPPEQDQGARKTHSTMISSTTLHCTCSREELSSVAGIWPLRCQGAQAQLRIFLFPLAPTVHTGITPFFFFSFFSIMVYYKILNIFLCLYSRTLLIIYFIYSSVNLLIPSSYLIHTLSFSFGNHKFVFYVSGSILLYREVHLHYF